MQIERNDEEEAEQILVTLVPDDTERKILLKQLLESIDVANTVAPDAWSVTLYGNGFRLNVGQVEVLTFFDGRLLANLAGTLGTPPLTGAGFADCRHPYSTVPQPKCAFSGTIREFVRVQDAIRQAHRQFVTLAARSPSGKPRRGSPHRKSHCEGLVIYARRLTSGVHRDMAPAT